MSRTTALAFLVGLLIFVSLSQAARPEPSSPKLVGGEQEKVNEAGLEGCDGVGEEECLTRRTLTAHLDYIYTQEKKH